MTVGRGHGFTPRVAEGNHDFGFIRMSFSFIIIGGCWQGAQDAKKGRSSWREP